MRLPTRWATVLLTLLVALGLSATAANAAVWSSSDKWATWSDGGYTVRNNIWDSGAGPQTIWANSYGNWGVSADHPDTGGVKAYPHSGRIIDKRLSELNSLKSSFDVSVPADGSYATAYDIWCDDYGYEIMLWANQNGPVGPIGSQRATVSVGGHSWDVYKGSNGSNAVFSFVRNGDANAGTVDIKAVLNWIADRGWFSDDVSVQDVQFGFEITSSSGGLEFVSNSYSVTSS
ncbi:hypothetical protein FHX42_003727 [Saccharopolyspora lacisalsi]|uniref:Glycosyl hydrolase family 12 n=1 Tax=Halosaccharopolyspora lacisalsi TaxID=1000566 RepID=A0A839E4U2_9PSEU|nr:hypothetical protein [Halosaccharopolyspora lacisalsi]MBA8826351.1 hypothetical protein [Halosaccharopolyspora lacisalsi]